MDIGTLVWSVALFGLGIEIFMLLACLQFKLDWDRMDSIAAILNESMKFDLPMHGATWRPMIIIASIMTPLVIGLFILAISLGLS